MPSLAGRTAEMVSSDEPKAEGEKEQEREELHVATSRQELALRIG